MKFPIPCFLMLTILTAGGCAVSEPSLPEEPLPQLLIIEQPAGSIQPVAIPESAEPAGLVWTMKDGTTRAMDADSTHISASIMQCLARTDVTQHFDGAKIPAAAVQGSYELVLPRETVVRDFLLTIGDRQMRAVVRESADAQRIYDLAKQHGLTATLVRAGQDNDVRVQLGQLPPGPSLDMKLQYVQSLIFTDGWFEYRYPLAGHEGKVDLSADIDGAAPIGEVDSPTQTIEPVIDKNGSAHVTVTNPTEDFVLRYRLASDAPQAVLMHGPKKTTPADPGYFSLMLVPGRGGELDDLHVTWQGKTTNLVGILPATLDTQPIVIAGQGDPGALISGTWNGKPLQLNVTASPRADAADVAWAMLKLADDQRAFEATSDPALVEQMKQTALDFSMVTPLTSLLLVDAAKPESKP